MGSLFFSSGVTVESDTPRPPKARTPPALPSPGRTSFPLSEWNCPRRTYRFLEDIPLVLTPPPVFASAPAACQQPPLPPDPSPLPRSDTPPALRPSPPVDDTAIAAPPNPRFALPPPVDRGALLAAAQKVFAAIVADKASDASAATPASAPDPRPEPRPLPIDQGEEKPQRKNRRSRRRRY